MMMSEFIERTKYEPSYEEYQIIEESYYDFNGNKDEFCKQWLKDKKDGHWEKELMLRRMLADQKAEYEKKLAEVNENVDFYRPYFDRAWNAEKKVKEQEEQMKGWINRAVEAENKVVKMKFILPKIDEILNA